MPSSVYFLQQIVIVRLDVRLLDPTLDLFALVNRRKQVVQIDL